MIKIGEPVIEVKGLCKTFEQLSGLLTALDEATFQVQAGEFVCILGPSGCGKSTILNIIAQLDKDFRGEVNILGQELGQSRVKVAYVFQEPRLLPWLTVEQNLTCAMRWSGVESAAIPGIIKENLSLVGLAGFEKSFPHQLSGGMQQRVAIARAFSTNPDVLLMDEPFSGLDEITARSLRKELVRIWEQTGKSIIFVTHNWFEATFLSDRIIMMSKRPGRVLQEFNVPMQRPRDYEDPDLFAYSSYVVKEFLKTIGED